MNVTDLSAHTSQVRQRTVRAADLIETSLTAAAAPSARHAFMAVDAEGSRQAAAAADRALVEGRDAGALCGLAVSIKDLFDVQGQPTRAGSTWLGADQPARADAPAVARLRKAGAALVGRTQMTEFAFSGVGVNPHFGTPAAYDGRHGALPGPARVPGGSSSGAAVSVATGAAFIGLGSDTGGSIRIPAALNGIVGFKNTARLTPAQGALPLSTTLDTVCAMTRTVSDAIVAHEIVARRRVTRSAAPLSCYRLAVPTTVFLDGLEAPVARAFERTIEQLRGAGAQIAEIDLPPMLQQPAYGFAAPENYA